MDRSALTVRGSSFLPARRLRGPALLMVLALVLALHAWIGSILNDVLADPTSFTPPIERLEAVYTRELQLAAAPAPAPARPAPRPQAAPKPEPVTEVAAAAEPEPAASAPIDGSAPTPAATAQGVSEAVAQVGTADAAQAPGEPEASSPQVELTSVPLVDASAMASEVSVDPHPDWPLSSRLSYTLSGYFRGDVEGSAQVEWIRRGDRYQVHISVFVGPEFAALMSRRMSSDGRITTAGLAPSRYDEVTRIAFATRQSSVSFRADEVLLANGRTVPSVPGIQDTASQFVQLTWRLSREPARWKPGETIDFPLALARRQDRWVYDVVAEDILQTPFGPLPALHLKPRRHEHKPKGELLVEMWHAPSLQYLPVRLRLQQDDDSFVDLMIRQLPEQAGLPAPAVRP